MGLPKASIAFLSWYVPINVTNVSQFQSLFSLQDVQSFADLVISLAKACFEDLNVVKVSALGKLMLL